VTGSVAGASLSSPRRVCIPYLSVPLMPVGDCHGDHAVEGRCNRLLLERDVDAFAGGRGWDLAWLAGGVGHAAERVDRG